MKTSKLIIGIIAIVLSVVLFFQSVLVGLGDALFAEEGEESGGYKMVMAILLLIGGIVSISARKTTGGGIFCLVDYALSGLIGLSFSADFADLAIWGTISLIFSGVFLLSLIVGRRRKHEEE